MGEGWSDVAGIRISLPITKQRGKKHRPANDNTKSGEESGSAGHAEPANLTALADSLL